jgi:hypothetical protein
MPVFETRETAMKHYDILIQGVMNRYKVAGNDCEEWFLKNDQYAPPNAVLDSCTQILRKEGYPNARVVIEQIHTKIIVSGTVAASAAVNPYLSLSFTPGETAQFKEFSGCFASTEDFQQVKSDLFALLDLHFSSDV